MNDIKLNSLVIDFQSTRNEETFRSIYKIVSKGWVNLETVAKSIRSNKADVLAVYEDELMKCTEIYDRRTNFINLLNRYIWRKRRRLYTKMITRNKFEQLEHVREDGAATSLNEISCDFVLEEEVINSINAKRKADQRQLIDFLVCGENERTTSIVQTFLSTDLKSPTAIGKHLGLDHKQITRALKKLASKFDTKQFGDYHDYLVAL